ncbi:MAG: GPW/gp25 family protein [Clostridia bacterium]|nr:GPW/gp25 family protein [Clostridia bacterium]
MKIIEGFGFPIDIDETSGKIKTVNNNQAVKQSINMILKTQIIEHKIFKNYGSELKSFMFGIVDSNYIYSFKKSVETAIKKWEPHVNEMIVDVKSSAGATSEIEANIEYTTDISPTIERTKRKININN